MRLAAVLERPARSSRGAAPVPVARRGWSDALVGRSWFEVWTVVLAAGVVQVTTGVLVYLGPTIDNSFPHDLPIFLDGAWRILQGQFPHVDFYTPLGPVSLLVVALGMRVAGPGLEAIAIANAISCVVISAWTWGICRPRMSAVGSLVVTVYTALLIAGTSVHGYGPQTLGYAALYNRYGAALCAPLLVEAFLPLRDRDWKLLSLAGGVSTGVVVVLLFFLKAPFFIGALGLIVTAAVIRRHEATRWYGVVLGVCAAALPFVVALRFDVASVVSDLGMGGGSRVAGVGGTGLPLLEAVVTSPGFYSAAYLMLAIAVVGRRGSRWDPAGRVVAAAAFITMQALITVSSGQPSAFFVLGLCALVLAAMGEEGSPPAARPSARTRVAPGFLLALFFVVLVGGTNVQSIRASLEWKRMISEGATAPSAFSSPGLADFLVVGHASYQRYVNSGVDMLNRHADPSDRVVTFDFTNMFPFALRWPSPRGDALWWHAGVTFDAARHPSAEGVFREVTVIMVPGRPIVGATRDAMLRLYGGYLDGRFAIAASDEDWTLYRRVAAD